MTYVTWKVERQAYSGSTSSGWTGATTEITTIQDPQVVVNLGEAKDSFTFTLSNGSQAWSNYFQPNDKIIISRVVNAASCATSDIIMVGTVGSPSDTWAQDQKIVRVEGFNFSETILSGITFADTQGKTVANAIQILLNSVGVYNGSFGVTWNTNNRTTKRDGSAFPLVTERWFNKNVKNFIEKYSSNATTEDGNYYWYVDKDNTLVWKARVDNATSSFDASTNVYRSLKLGKDIKDVRNWVLIKCGTDPLGNAITTRVEDPASIGAHGLKPYILPNVAKNAEMFAKQDAAYFGVQTMADASYPLTPTWTTTSATAYKTGANNYVALLRAFAVASGKTKGNAFLSRSKYGKLVVDVEASPGTTGQGCGLGDVIACTIPAIGAEAKNLRVKEIRYSTSSDTYRLEEDTGSL
jgi:hypothetical protein